MRSSQQKEDASHDCEASSFVDIQTNYGKRQFVLELVLRFDVYGKFWPFYKISNRVAEFIQ